MKDNEYVQFSNLKFIILAETFLTTINLFFFMPHFDIKYEPIGHLIFYVFVYYPFCIFSWILLHNMIFTCQELSPWFEVLISTLAGIAYVLCAILCVGTLEYEDSYGRVFVSPTMNERWQQNRYCSLLALLTGLLFIVHAILSTDMEKLSGDDDESGVAVPAVVHGLRTADASESVMKARRASVSSVFSTTSSDTSTENEIGRTRNRNE